MRFDVEKAVDLNGIERLKKNWIIW